MRPCFANSCASLRSGGILGSLDVALLTQAALIRRAERDKADLNEKDPIVSNPCDGLLLRKACFGKAVRVGISLKCDAYRSELAEKGRPCRACGELLARVAENKLTDHAIVHWVIAFSSTTAACREQGLLWAFRRARVPSPV